MSYVNRVESVLKNPSEKALVDLICETVTSDDTVVKAK